MSRIDSTFILNLKCTKCYSFPDAKNNPEMYGIWVENVNRNAPVQFVPTKGSRICAEHFSKDMIEEGGQRVILKPYAIPTIFPNSQVCAFMLIFHVWSSKLNCLNYSMARE